MEEYIKKSLIQKTLDEGTDDWSKVRAVMTYLNCTESNVAILRHGRWLHHTMIDGHIHAECSECHKVRIIDNFCSNCGALMDGE